MTLQLQTFSVKKIKSKDKQNLMKVLKYLSVLLQFVGVLPIRGNSKILLQLQRIWCGFILLTIWSKSIQRALLLDESLTNLEKGLYIGELTFASMLPLNIFIMSFTHKKKFHLFCEKLKSVKQQLKLCRGLNGCSYKSYCKKLRQELFFLTTGLLLFYAFCLILNLVYSHGSIAYVWDVFGTYHLSNIIISANLCVYWLSLRFISLAIDYLNSILKSFQNDSLAFSSASSIETLWFQREFGFSRFKSSLKFYDILTTLSEISSSLDELYREVVKMFRTILILNFINSFLILVLQFFAVYKFFDSPNVRTLLVFLLKGAYLFLHTFNVILILLSNTVIINQKCQTIYILNSLPLDTLNMEKSITHFLLQFMVRKHTIYVADIFELDLTFLLAITSTLSTYVIFLIQIDLGVESIEETIAANS